MEQEFEYRGGSGSEGICFYAFLISGGREMFVKGAPESIIRPAAFSQFFTEIDFFKIFLKWKKTPLSPFPTPAQFFVMLYPTGKEITIKHPGGPWLFRFTGKFLTDAQIKEVLTDPDPRFVEYARQAILPREELRRIVTIKRPEPTEIRGRKLYKERSA